MERLKALGSLRDLGQTVQTIVGSVWLRLDHCKWLIRARPFEGVTTHRGESFPDVSRGFVRRPCYASARLMSEGHPFHRLVTYEEMAVFLPGTNESRFSVSPYLKPFPV
jgi:hypothetical protein